MRNDFKMVFLIVFRQIPHILPYFSYLLDAFLIVFFQSTYTRIKKQLVNHYQGSTYSLCPIYCGKVFPINREKILLFCGNKFS